ncbi:YoaK family protein [Nocardioides sp. AN3]
MRTLILVVTSGATDAVGFLALGGAFTSVMTGNLVLLGVAVAHANSVLAAHTVTAIGSFVMGAWLGARVSMSGRGSDDDPAWPRGVTRALCVELAVLSTFAVWWWATEGTHRDSVWFALMLNAAALGIQSSAVQRFGVTGLSTTYLTGTLTTLVVALASGRSVGDLRHSAASLLALVGGAVAGALMCSYAPAWVPALQLGLLISVLTSARLVRRPRQEPVCP